MASTPDSSAKTKRVPRRKAKPKAATGARAKKAAPEKAAEPETKPDAGADAKAPDAAAETAAKAKPEESAGDASPDDKGQSADKADTPPTDPPHEPPRVDLPRSRMTGAARGLAWVTLVMGLVVAVGAVTWPWWSERFADVLPILGRGGSSAQASAELSGRINALESAQSGALKQLEAERAKFREELKALIGRIDEVETSVKETRGLLKAVDAKAETEAASQSLKALSERLQALERDGGQIKDLAARVSAVESTAPSAGAPAVGSGPGPAVVEMQASLADVQARVKKLEDQPAGAGESDDQARAIVLAVAQLRDSLRRGTPLKKELEALRAVAAGHPEIDQAAGKLDAFAAAGAPTVAELRNRFSAVAGSVVAAGTGPDGGDWMSRAVDKLSSLVQVRRVGEAAPPGSIDADVAAIDGLLAAGDLKGAVDKVAKLEGKAAAAVQPWRAEAERRLAAEKAVAGLHVLAVSLLTPKPSGS